MHSRHHHLLPMQPRLIFALVLAAPVPAQVNLVTNGDFAKDLVGWTLTNTQNTSAAGIVTSDVAGTGASKAFRADMMTGRTNHARPRLAQDIQVVAGAKYEVSFDVMVSHAGGYATMPQVSAILAGTTIKSSSRVPETFHLLPLTSFRRYRFTDWVIAATSGRVEFGVNLGHATFTSTKLPSAAAPVVQVDNISVARTVGPTLQLRWDRTVGATLVVRLLGDSQFSPAVVLAGARQNPPIQVPGWQGLLHLRSPAVTLTQGWTDPNGWMDLPVRIPAAAVGIGVWLQGAESDRRGRLYLSLPQHANVY